MRYYVLLIGFFMLNCAIIKHDVFIENIPETSLNNENRYDLDNVIYPVNREFIFKCTIEYNDETLDLNLKFIKMTIQGTTAPFSKFDPDYSQTVIKFEYLDENNNRIIWEQTGVVENEKNIWLHPPRNADLDILQLSAFPYFKFGSIKKWTWKLDAGYGNYKDVHLTHSYRKVKPISYESEMGILECTPVYATSKSYVGTTFAYFLFNQTYGFVKLKFETIEGTTITLDLIDVAN